MKLNLNEVVTIDFETYYDSKYSLRAKVYNTSSYIMDPQFQIHCCAIKVGTKKSKCYWGREAVEKALKAIDWTKHDLLAHNNFFDGAIAKWHLGIKPRRRFCTVQMTRGLHSDMSKASLDAICKFYGIGGKISGLEDVKGTRTEDIPKDKAARLMEYCNNDNEKCFEVFKKQIAVYPEREIQLVDITLSMFCDPVFQLDVERAEKSLNYEMNERLKFIAISRHDEKTLTSTPKFVAALEALGVKAPQKISKRTGQVSYALSETDEEFIALQEHEDIRVVRLVQGRLAAKSTMMETRAWRMLQAQERCGALPVLLNYYGAKCVPGNTEVLTRTGWVPIKDWNDTDEIAQVVPASRETVFLPATKFVGERERRWVVVDAPYLKCAFTEGHTMPYLKHDSFDWATMQAGDATERSSWYAPVAGELSTSGVLTPIQMRVLAMVQADGSFETDSSVGRKLKISVKKPRKVERALHLLIKAGVVFEVKHYDSTPGYTHYIVRAAQYPAWLTEDRKFFGSWLLDSIPEAREAFIDELQHWDGWVQSNQQCYSSSEFVNADWVATLCHLTNRSASILEKQRGDGRRTNYVVTIRERGHCLIRQRHITTKELYEIPVCATTQTGFFLARSNRRIFVTGNTGRWSGGNKMNFQNLPTSTKDFPMAGELRKAILAPPGHVLIAPDSSQIEARTVAWVSGHEALLTRFRNKEDVYKWMAGLIYGIDPADVDDARRFIGKIAVLGLGYGMGAKRFQTTLALGVMGPPVQMSMTECARIVKMYRKINQAIVEFWRECENVLEAMTRGESGSFGPGGILQYEGTSIWLPNGMGLHYPGLRALWNPNTNQIQGFKYKSNGADKHIYGGLLCENIVQALAGVIIREEMVEVDNLYARTKLKKGEIAKIATMTHDEIVSVIPERLGQKLLDANLKIMKTPPAWAPDLPINAEAVGWATNYSI